ncbi:hypothetical protein [Gaoshiqia sp. Z1-71]|uniref:hypothetical protein n=1 Tax=Gaoshiqia hydrogeniformans TaxID=3290090 RepID=UPI003BF8D9C2
MAIWLSVLAINPGFYVRRFSSAPASSGYGSNSFASGDIAVVVAAGGRCDFNRAGIFILSASFVHFRLAGPFIFPGITDYPWDYYFEPAFMTNLQIVIRNSLISGMKPKNVDAFKLISYGTERK